ncbi:MAG: hypothetical protein AAFQ23_09125 [Cyanobacteria bacterium J06623_1]
MGTELITSSKLRFLPTLNQGALFTTIFPPSPPFEPSAKKVLLHSNLGQRQNKGILIDNGNNRGA